MPSRLPSKGWESGLESAVSDTRLNLIQLPWQQCSRQDTTQVVLGQVTLSRPQLFVYKMGIRPLPTFLGWLREKPREKALDTQQELNK